MNTTIETINIYDDVAEEYYTMRKTKKELFKMYLQRAMNKIKED